MMNHLMFLLALAPWDAVERIFRHLFDALIPIGICVILPIIVITLSLRTRRHEIDKKTEVMMKALENGAQLDPSFFESAAKAGCKEKTVKDKLMGWLLAAGITSGIGVLGASVLIYTLSLDNHLQKNPEDALLLIFPALLLAVGIAFFIVYFVGKNKTWKKELAELDAQKPEEQAL